MCSWCGVGDGDYNPGGFRFRDVDQAMATDSQCDAIGNAVNDAAPGLLFTDTALFYNWPKGPLQCNVLWEEYILISIKENSNVLMHTSEH